MFCTHDRDAVVIILLFFWILLQYILRSVISVFIRFKGRLIANKLIKYRRRKNRRMFLFVLCCWVLSLLLWFSFCLMSFYSVCLRLGLLCGKATPTWHHHPVKTGKCIRALNRRHKFMHTPHPRRERETHRLCRIDRREESAIFLFFFLLSVFFLLLRTRITQTIGQESRWPITTI